MDFYFVDRKPSAMGHVPHMTKVPMYISSHRELAPFQVANLQNQKVILGMPWLIEHNPRMDRNSKKITCDSKQCMTWCFNSLHFAYAGPEKEVLEENLNTGFSKIQAKKGQIINDQGVRVKRL